MNFSIHDLNLPASDGTRIDPEVHKQHILKFQDSFNNNSPTRIFHVMPLATNVSSEHSFRVELALEVYRKFFPSHSITVTSNGVLRGGQHSQTDEQVAAAAAKTSFLWADAFLAASVTPDAAA